MKERPILFNGDMVRAILEGRKMQTRRPIKPQPIESEYQPGLINVSFKQPKTIVVHGKTIKKGSLAFATVEKDYFLEKCPFGQPGDRLWVRETWMKVPNIRKFEVEFLYKADLSEKDLDVIANEWPGKWRWKPSIHMPREASRITLEIDEIRVERVQEISAADACQEGVRGPIATDLKFKFLWNDLYSKQGADWNLNPWVWVVKFHRVEVNK